MRRGTFLIALGLVVATAASPVAAGHNGHDHSSNMSLIQTVPLDWPIAEENEGTVPYAGDVGMQGRLLVAGVIGHPPVSPQGDVPESGIAVYRLGLDGLVQRRLSVMRCHAYSDITVWGNTVFQGVIESQQQDVEDKAGADRSDRCDREGFRVLDISDPTRPRQSGFIDIPCGVGESTIVPDGPRLYAYVASTCDEQTDTPTSAGAYAELSIYRVFPRRPKKSYLASKVSILPLNGCSNMTVFVPRRLVVCVGDARFTLLDASDVAQPRVLTPTGIVLPRNVGPAAFSWDGQLLALGDAQVNTVDPDVSSIYLFNIEDPGNPQRVGTWQTPAAPGGERWVHSLSFIPMKGQQDVLVVGAGQLGVRLVDVTDRSSPKEVGYYSIARPEEQGPLYVSRSTIAIAHWYNGRIYGSDGSFRVFKVRGFGKAATHSFRRFNPETQMRDFM